MYNSSPLKNNSAQLRTEQKWTPFLFENLKYIGKRSIDRKSPEKHTNRGRFARPKILQRNVSNLAYDLAITFTKISGSKNEKFQVSDETDGILNLLEIYFQFLFWYRYLCYEHLAL